MASPPHYMLALGVSHHFNTTLGVYHHHPYHGMVYVRRTAKLKCPVFTQFGYPVAVKILAVTVQYVFLPVSGCARSNFMLFYLNYSYHYYVVNDEASR